MTITDARELVAKIAHGELDLQATQHFWDQARMRKLPITKPMVYALLRSGTVDKAPEPDKERGNHVVTVRGELPDLGKIEVVLGVCWFDDAHCITVYAIK